MSDGCEFDFGNRILKNDKYVASKSVMITNSNGQQLKCSRLGGGDAEVLSNNSILIDMVVYQIKIDIYMEYRDKSNNHFDFKIYMGNKDGKYDFYVKGTLIKKQRLGEGTWFDPIITSIAHNRTGDNCSFDKTNFDCMKFIGDKSFINYQFKGDGGWGFTYYIDLPPINTPDDLNIKPILISNTIKSNPIIIIKSQLFIDYSDIGDTTYTIYCNNKQNIYKKECVKIVDVLKGKGNTAWEKLNDIFYYYKIGVKGYIFLRNMMEYSTARYLFTKLLYGKFIMKFLLQKYYTKFLEDLKISKYNSYYSYFTQGEYQNYYRYFLKNNT